MKNKKKKIKRVIKKRGPYKKRIKHVADPSPCAMEIAQDDCSIDDCSLSPFEVLKKDAEEIGAKLGQHIIETFVSKKDYEVIQRRVNSLQIQVVDLQHEIRELKKSSFQLKILDFIHKRQATLRFVAYYFRKEMNLIAGKLKRRFMRHFFNVKLRNVMFDLNHLCRISFYVEPNWLGKKLDLKETTAGYVGCPGKWKRMPGGASPNPAFLPKLDHIYNDCKGRVVDEAKEPKLYSDDDHISVHCDLGYTLPPLIN
jgi:hypothetical protein